MSSVISHITPKNSLAKHLTILQTIVAIESKVELILSDITKKTDPEFITYILNIVENLVSSKFTQNEKTEIVLQFLRKHFEISESELNTILQIIHFAYDNKQVKKISNIKKVFYSIFDIGKSKLAK
uniref:Uncharacterized protein n=1 Tax=viral metagenome TaxID=1070528 RepID=A0A6C0H539_9ZZZZ